LAFERVSGKHAPAADDDARRPLQSQHVLPGRRGQNVEVGPAAGLEAVTLKA
jgi:hypothetical protein